MQAIWCVAGICYRVSLSLLSLGCSIFDRYDVSWFSFRDRLLLERLCLDVCCDSSRDRYLVELCVCRCSSAAQSVYPELAVLWLAPA